MRTFFSIILLACFSFQARSQAKDLGEFIYTVPLKKQISVTQLQTEWWREYLEWPVQADFFKKLILRIDSGKVQVLLPEYPYTKVASATEIRNILHHADTNLTEDPITGELVYVIYTNNFNVGEIVSVTFVEDWSFNESDLSFTKKVKGFIPNKEYISPNTGEVLGEKPLFFVPVDKMYGLNTNKGSVSDKKDIPFITYNFTDPNLFPDDNAKMLQYAQRAKFLAYAETAVQKQNAFIYDSLFPYTNHPDKKELAVILQKLNTCNGLRFYEEWVLDAEQLSFEKKVKGIVLQQELNKHDSISRKECAFIALNGFVPSDPFKQSTLTVNKISSSGLFVSFNRVPAYWGFQPFIHSDSAKIMNAAVFMANTVKQHKVQCYKGAYDDPWDMEYHIPRTDKEVDNIFTSYDSVFYEEADGPGGWKQVEHPLPFDRMVGLRFFESWNVDLKTLHFEKNIRSMAPLFLVPSQEGDWKGIQQLFTFDLPPVKPEEIKQAQFLIAENVSHTVPIDFDVKNASPEFMTNGESGILWDDSWMENLYQYDYYPLIQGMLDGIYSGKIKAWHYATDKKMSPKDARLKLDALKDSSFVKPGDLSTDYTLVNRLVFLEDWYFDPATLRFYKEVKAVTLVCAKPKNEGPLGDRVWHDNLLFTVKFN